MSSPTGPPPGIATGMFFFLLDIIIQGKDVLMTMYRPPAQRRLCRPQLAVPRRTARRARHHLRLHALVRARTARRYHLPHLLRLAQLAGVAAPVVVLRDVLRRPAIRDCR